MTDRAPAAPLHEAVLETLRAQGKSKNWLHKHSKVARNTIDRWRVQPNPPQAATVIAVADVLGLDRSEALRLGGVIADVEVEVESSGRAVALDEVDTDVLLAEIRRRIPD